MLSRIFTQPKKRALLAAALCSATGFLSTASATPINYTIAPQNLLTWSNQFAGTTWGTFTADFSSQQITEIDFYVDIAGDKTYLFNTPKAFGAQYASIFPGLTYYEADLQTSTFGPWTSTFFMDFLQENTAQLFRGNPVSGGVYTSFGHSTFILEDAPPLSSSVPESSVLGLMIVGFSLMNRRVRQFIKL